MTATVEEETQTFPVRAREVTLRHPSRGVTIEPPIVFWYNREPERRIERAVEQALPNFRQIRAAMSQE